MDVQLYVPTEFHCSAVCDKGLSVSQWIVAGNVQWTFSCMLQWNFTFVTAGVKYVAQNMRLRRIEPWKATGAAFEHD